MAYIYFGMKEIPFLISFFQSQVQAKQPIKAGPMSQNEGPIKG